MTNFMRLADDTEIKIEDGASLGNIVYIAASEADGLEKAGFITKENVSHVEFFAKTEEDVTLGPYGVYDNLAITSVYFDVPNLQVLISLHEKSDIELRLDAIEAEQEEQNAAIDFLVME